MSKWQRRFIIGIFVCIGIGWCSAAAFIYQIWPRTIYLTDEQTMSLLIEDIEYYCSQSRVSVFYVCDRVDFRENQSFQQAVERAKQHGLTVKFALVSTEEEDFALARISNILGVDTEDDLGFWTAGALVCGSQRENGQRKLRYRPYSKRALWVRGEAEARAGGEDAAFLLFFFTILAGSL